MCNLDTWKGTSGEKCFKGGVKQNDRGRREHLLALLSRCVWEIDFLRPFESHDKATGRLQPVHGLSDAYCILHAKLKIFWKYLHLHLVILQMLLSKRVTVGQYIKHVFLKRQTNRGSACNTKFQALFKYVQARREGIHKNKLFLFL